MAEATRTKAARKRTSAPTSPPAQRGHSLRGLAAWRAAIAPITRSASGASSGKKFDPAKKQGVNTLTDSARWPAKLIWPLYSTKDSPLGRSAFDFNTYVEPGRLDPDVKVLVIDYESVPENPSLLIRQIRDELVEIVPGANLGKMLVRVPRRKELVPALYFALRSDA
jgi:hypothetical protein